MAGGQPGQSLGRVRNHDATREPVPVWKRKGFLAIAGIVVVAVLGVAIVLPMLLDVERYRPHIEQALRDATGWEPALGSIDVASTPSGVTVHSPVGPVSPISSSPPSPTTTQANSEPVRRKTSAMRSADDAEAVPIS